MVALLPVHTNSQVVVRLQKAYFYGVLSNCENLWLPLRLVGVREVVSSNLAVPTN